MGIEVPVRETTVEPVGPIPPYMPPTAPEPSEQPERQPDEEDPTLVPA